MRDVLLVHGTGVRLASYDRSIALVRRQAAKFLNGATVHPCLWGEAHGATLNIAGASIPGYDDTAAPTPSEAVARELDEAAWRMLAEDPLFEIRLLEGVPAARRELAPMDQPPGRKSLQLVQTLRPSPEVTQFLRDKELNDYWEAAHTSLAGKPELERILLGANRDVREVSRALARALTAALIMDAQTAGHPGVSAASRTRLVDLLIPLLGGRPLGPFDWVTKPLIGIAKRAGTIKGRRNRRALTDGASPAAGDILLYQARGDSIRAFIRDRIRELPDDSIVIAHSLGGIAMVDLLVSEDLSDKVSGLVTVGSQASFLYEINALWSLPFGTPLPAHFPRKWLNFWDPNDFLSYVGAGVFGGRAVTDHMTQSGLSFPDSHSAYWDQDSVWQRIAAFFH